jgi:hypothetical protein
MEAESYLKERVNDQIEWYEQRSSFAKRGYYGIMIIEMVVALSITVGTALDISNVILSILGALILFLTGCRNLFKFHENWISYRTTAESLKHEKFLYLTDSDSHSDPTSLGSFVGNIEALISKENSNWNRRCLKNKNLEHEVKNELKN